MDLREALSLVADDADRTQLVPPAQVRQRGDRIVRRRRATAALAGVTVVLLAVGVVVGAGGLHARPAPVQPPVPHPSPTVTVSPLVFRPGCGFSQACPQGTGPFVAVLGANRGGDHLSVELTLPPGWSIREGGDHVLATQSTDGTQGLTVLWPTLPVVAGQDARAVAAQLAALPGSAAPAARHVSVSGHVGWQVTFQSAPPGTVECVDPGSRVFDGEDLLQGRTLPGHCRPLLRLSAVHTGQAVQVNPLGLVDHLPAQVTLVDGLDVAEAGRASILALWRWGGDVAVAPPAGTLLDGLRLGHFADPSCSWSRDEGSPLCVAHAGVYVSRGDPVQTIDGIHTWRSQASLHVPAGWSVAADDGWGTTDLADSRGLSGAFLAWGPGVPGPPTTPLTDARAWAAHLAADPTLARAVPVAVTLGGRPAWRLDLTPRRDVYPFRQAPDTAQPYTDVRCGGQTEYYARAVACAPGPHLDTIYLEANVLARVWFVQAAPDRVLLVMVWGKRLHRSDPSPLPGTLAATAAMLRSISLSTT